MRELDLDALTCKSILKQNPWMSQPRKLSTGELVVTNGSAMLCISLPTQDTALADAETEAKIRLVLDCVGQGSGRLTTAGALARWAEPAPCEHCQGTRTEPCELCRQKGHVNCPLCGHPGVCPVCNGTMRTMCWHCRGPHAGVVLDSVIDQDLLRQFVRQLEGPCAVWPVPVMGDDQHNGVLIKGEGWSVHICGLSFEPGKDVSELPTFAEWRA